MLSWLNNVDSFTLAHARSYEFAFSVISGIEGFTTRYNVNNLVHYEMYSEVTDAISREKQIKSWTRKQKNALVESHNKRWDDLEEELLGF